MGSGMGRSARGPERSGGGRRGAEGSGKVLRGPQESGEVRADPTVHRMGAWRVGAVLNSTDSTPVRARAIASGLPVIWYRALAAQRKAATSNAICPGSTV